MAQIAELGIDQRLVEAAAAQGWVEATPLQASAIPVLRRGGNAVLHTSSGSGVTGAYVLPLLDRLAQGQGEDAARALVLVPTEEGASRIAQQIAGLGAPVGVRCTALAEGWPRGVRSDVIVATAPAALDALERSLLKLEAVQSFVVVDFDLIQRLGGGSAVETLTPLVPRDAQRVVSAAELTPEIEHYIEAHARRALTIPARPADPQATRETGEAAGTASYVIVPEAQKYHVLVRLLAARTEARPIVVTQSEQGAAQLRQTLAQRGYDVEGGETAGVRVESAQNAPATGASISFDVPYDADMLRSLHRNGGVLLVTPREVAHLRRIATEAHITLQAERADMPAADAVAEYRRMLRQAMHDEDTAAQLLVLEPLFQEFGAAEVAAALSALLRKRTPPAASQPRTAGAPKPDSATTAFVRLFISLGERDNVRPSDLVGAITGEAGIKGEQVGKIDIRDTFSVVEIASGVAEKVIRALNGSTLRGRSVRVDYDRKSGSSSGGSSGGAPPRRGAPSGGSRGGPPRGGDSRGGPPRRPPRPRA